MTTKEKIINASVKEFSVGGYPGARVENIASSAGVNKAMIFYYFGSKEGLYKIVIKKIVDELFEVIIKSGGLSANLKPEKFFENFPENYIRFFSDNREYLKVIGTELIQNPENLKRALRGFFNSETTLVPRNLRNVFEEWHKIGLITEPEPVHLFLNIISLCIFPIIARAIPETLFDLDLDNEQFIRERIVSVKNLLKRGILK